MKIIVIFFTLAIKKAVTLEVSIDIENLSTYRYL